MNLNKGFIKRFFRLGNIGSVIFLVVIGLWFACPSFSSGEETLPCEVIEVSVPYRGKSEHLGSLHYLLFHHANSADREKLSVWLKENTGTDVTFIINGKRYKGIIFRMPHCFGRGLIIHKNDIRLKKRDIFKIVIYQ